MEQVILKQFRKARSSYSRKARAKIIQLLVPVNYVHVKDARTARDAGKKMEAAFGYTGLTRWIILLRNLITTN